MLISSDAVSPISPTQRLPVDVSNHMRPGLRSPHAQMSSRGEPASSASGSMSHAPPQARPDVSLTSGLSEGMVPSRSTLRIFPLALVRQVANQLEIACPELQLPSPTPM